MPVLKYEDESGGSVWVEVEPLAPGEQSKAQAVKAGLAASGISAPKFQEALGAARPAIEGFQKLIASLEEKPDSVELTFGLKASAEVGSFLVFSKAGGEATFGLKLTWKKSASPAPGESAPPADA
jgi:hypothetical protein